MNLILTISIVILAIQLFGFSVAYTRQTDKLTDLWYGGTFFLLAVYLFVTQSPQGLVHTILLVMIVLWSLRLAGYLFVRIHAMKKDSRFDEMRKKPLKFLGFWLLQTLSIIVISLPFVFVLTQPNINLAPWSLLGAVLWAMGLAIESVADAQKFKFKQKKTTKHPWIQSGVWKYSRHPNYFGEILCWIGVFVYAVPYLQGWWWLSIISPLFIMLLLGFVSGIPLLEKSANKKYGNNTAYQKYKKETSVLIPWFKSKR